MILGRYLALAERTGGRPISHAVEQIAPCLARWKLKLTFRSGRLAIFTDDVLKTGELDGGLGCLLGDLYDRAASDTHMPSASDARLSLSPSDIGAPPASLWGNYVILADRASDEPVIAERSPFGGLPCYHATINGVTILASHVDLLIKAGLPAHIDWMALLAHLANINLRSATTCLAGVAELLPGRRLTLSATPRQTDIWSPWSFATRTQMIRDPIVAAEMLRSTVTGAVRALTSEASHLILGLSGGLDSSIVAAALAEAGARFSCLNLVSDDPSGDERTYARLVADHFGVPLIEAVERVEAIDICRSDAASLPRPVARAFAQSGDALNCILADDVGGDAFISGGGGDNVFCFLESARPVADRLLVEGPGRGALRTACDLSELTDSTIWSALRKGTRRAWFQDHHYRWPNDTTLLSPTAAALAGPSCEHGWTTAPTGELPGKAQHIAWVLGIQNHIEGYRREHVRSTIWPLLAQPVIEHCLRVPTWQWFDRGENRVIARRAFADALPAAIIRRRSKGTPDSFVVALFEHHRDKILPFLADGLLAQHRLIDREAVIAICRARGPTKGMIYWRIMGLVDAEAWARSWHERRPSTLVPH